MKPILLFCFSVCFLTSPAQDKNVFFALDSNMNQTVMDSSKYILWIHQKEDSNWQWDYYYTWGPLIKSKSYADHDGKILNVKFYLYNDLGNLDSTGEFDHGKKNGSFYRLRSYTQDKIVMIMQYDYVNDSLVKIKNLLADSNKIKYNDTIKEKESEYIGGLAEWRSYLKDNLQYPGRALDKNIHGIVDVRFVVNEEGNVEDVYILKSVEYSLDQESIRIIKNSGKWHPGIKNDIPVKTYKIQPVNF